jgi:hypothetical protein
MGPNFFGIEDARAHWGTDSEEDFDLLSEIPWPEADLIQNRDTHLLTAILPLSIIEMQNRIDQKLFDRRPWYGEKSFARERGEAGWQLIRKRMFPNSTSKTWTEQQELVGRSEETPCARVMVCMIVSHYLATGHRLFGNMYVRCSDTEASFYRVIVGGFRSNGLCISLAGNGRRAYDLGLSTSQKL